MDRIQAMQVFLRVAEAGSFVRAAETLSLPSSTVTSTIKSLEGEPAEFGKNRTLTVQASRPRLTVAC